MPIILTLEGCSRRIRSLDQPKIVSEALFQSSNKPVNEPSNK